MALSTEFVKEKIEQKLNALHVVRSHTPCKYITLSTNVRLSRTQEVTDTSCGSNCGQKLSVVVVSRLFEGKALLERHRLVHEALAEEIAQLHAFSQKTFTPSQWATKHS